MTDKTVKLIVLGVDKASEPLGVVDKAMGGLGKTILGAGAVGITALAGIGAGAVKLAVDAAPLADLAVSFEDMATAAGSSADDVLTAFKDQSAGMITNAAAMEAYNQATMLVSADFAETLPDAMLYLGKVSAATKTDMDYLLSSLTTGIGRLSGPILDNLNIQVDLNQAYEDWSAETGIAVAEMTKQEQQAALTAQVMELLKENTAALPDVLGTNTQRMAEMKASLTDLKDEAALALQPALQALLIPLGELAEEYGPKVTEWLGVAAEWLGEKVPVAIEATSAFLTETLRPAFDTVVAFVKDNATPILAGLGAVLLVTVVPAFVAWAAAAISAAAATVIALAPVLIPIAAIGAAVALLVAAWENDWGGIRTTLTGVWEDHLEPIFTSIKEWFDKTIPVALEFMADLWKNTLKPAFALVVDFVKDPLLVLFDALVELFDVGFTLATTALAGLWQNVLEPAFRVVYNFIKDHLQPIFDKLKEIVGTGLKVAIDTVTPIIDGLKGAFDTVKDAIQPVIDFIKKLTESLSAIELPDWLTPGSPTPFELGLRGIGKAIEGLPDLSFPVSMKGGLQAVGAPAGGGVGAGAAGGLVINNYFGRDSIRSDRDVIKVVEEQEKAFRLRGLRTL